MAGRPSRYVEPLTEEERELLDYLKDRGETPRIRRRAHGVLLSDLGKSVNEIAEIFGVGRNTVSSWLESWEKEGPIGLGDAPRPGAPPKLDASQQEDVIEFISEHPSSPRDVLLEIKKRFGKTISRSTLRRILRRFDLRWKRTRRSMKSKRDDEEFEAAQREIEEMKEEHRSGHINLYYFDEAGFSLVPPVRYAWQLIGETLEIPSQRSQRLNALGFLDLDSQFTPYVTEGTITTDVVIACFDNFVESLTKTSVVVIDNASVHSSKQFQSKIEEWQEKGLFLFFLPPYCPELNLIEILWRMIKYRWLPLEAYESFKSLLTHVSEVLSQVGEKFIVNFA